MHSHDDLGWLRTLEEYQSQAINPILSSTIDTLLKDPKATFTWCNIGFLYNYLQKFPQEIGKFQAAIKSGQLYVVNGGIAVHDNACVHLDDMLTNYEFGREFLQTKLGTNPNIGWLIDPFGHSKTTTRMYSKLGYRAYLINRISTYIRESMKERKQMLFNWVDPESDFKPMRMFELWDHYNTPSPMNFEVQFNNNNQVNPKPNIKLLSADFDLLIKCYQFYRAINAFAHSYPSQNVLIPIGDDFTFRNYPVEYSYWRVIKQTMNMNSKGVFPGSQFSLTTGGQYFEAIQKEVDAGLKIPDIKVEDFFPLLSEFFDRHTIAWTGYFTTRPSLKRAIKRLGQVFRGITDLIAASTLEALSHPTAYYNMTHHVRWLIGVLTHHDAVTGTCMARVCSDYFDYINNATKIMSPLLSQHLLQPILGSGGKLASIEDVIDLTEYSLKDIPVTIKNIISLSTHVLQTGSMQIKIRTQQDITVSVQSDGQSASFVGVLCDDILKCEHVFTVPYRGKGISSLQISLSTSKGLNKEALDNNGAATLTFSNGKSLTIGIHRDRISLQEKGSLLPGGSANVSMGWFVYRYSQQWCSVSKHYAGSYAFSTCRSAPYGIEIASARVHSFEAKSAVISLTFNEDALAAHVIYDSTEANPILKIQVRTNMQKLYSAFDEVDFVLRVSSDIKTQGNFVTDSNGLEGINRKYGGEKGDSPEFNYYPLTEFIYVQDENQRLSLLVDRPEGGSAPFRGGVEAMFQRWNQEKDDLGLEGPLLENSTVSVAHTILLENIATKDLEFFRQESLRGQHPIIYATVVNASNTVSSGKMQAGDHFAKTRFTNSNNLFKGEHPLLRFLFDSRGEQGIMLRIYNLSHLSTLSTKILTSLQALGIKGVFKRELDFNRPASTTLTEPLPTSSNLLGQQLTLKPLELLTLQLTI